jgi:hypothetical protein
MITKSFRSYSMSYLRQKTNFRDHRPDVALVRCSRDSRDCRGPRGQLRLDNSSAARLRPPGNRPHAGDPGLPATASGRSRVRLPHQNRTGRYSRTRSGAGPGTGHNHLGRFGDLPGIIAIEVHCPRSVRLWSAGCTGG